MLEWSDDEIARRWLQLYPVRDDAERRLRHAEILSNPVRIAEYRRRLCDLSWFMKSLSEPIARRANAEDDCTGRFWEGRYKCQLLTSEKALLAACVYVDLNPIRAGIAKSVATSKHTGVQRRVRDVRAEPERAKDRLRPLFGVLSSNIPKITVADYIELVDHTGRQWHPGKRGAIPESEPPALRKLGLDSAHWTMQVKAIGSGYWRVVGTVDELVEYAKTIGQQWLRGIGVARILER